MGEVITFLAIIFGCFMEFAGVDMEYDICTEYIGIKVRGRVVVSQVDICTSV